MGVVDNIYSEIAQERSTRQRQRGVPCNGELWITRDQGTVLRRLEEDAERDAIQRRAFTARDFLFTKKVARYYVETPVPEKHCSMHEVLETNLPSLSPGDVIMMYTDGLRGRWY